MNLIQVLQEVGDLEQKHVEVFGTGPAGVIIHPDIAAELRREVPANIPVQNVMFLGIPLVIHDAVPRDHVIMVQDPTIFESWKWSADELVTRAMAAPKLERPPSKLL